MWNWELQSYKWSLHIDGIIEIWKKGAVVSSVIGSMFRNIWLSDPSLTETLLKIVTGPSINIWTCKKIILLFRSEYWVFSCPEIYPSLVPCDSAVLISRFSLDEDVSLSKMHIPDASMTFHEAQWIQNVCDMLSMCSLCVL